MVGPADRHRYKWFIYDEHIKDSLSVVTKIKFDKDTRARGITMMFLQRSDLEKIAADLKIKPTGYDSKRDMVDAIIATAMQAQHKARSAMIIYRLLDM